MKFRWWRRILGWAILAALPAWGPDTGAALPTNAVLFVTQVQLPDERNDNAVSNVAVSVVSPLGNHLADTAHAGRGGDLWIRYPNGYLRNLTRAAGLGATGSQDGIGIAVRDPHVHWDGQRALVSMVIGAPTGPADPAQFLWQLYELTNLGQVATDSNAVPVFVRVPRQPAGFNNVMACYGTDDRIIFVCDRPRNGAAHLYPQLDEYNDIPTNTGLWSFDPAGPGDDGGLFQLDHSPSGDFHPFVDSFGRVIFTRWDHLVQDRNATDDRMGRATNGTFNYFSEDRLDFNLSHRPIELFPEPRTYDSNECARLQVQGNAFNSFLPWMIGERGEAMEVLNHIGRHELLRQFRGSSFTNDPNLRQLFNLTPGLRFNTNYLDNLLQIREDPRRPGVYYGTDGPDFGTHGSGQLVMLTGPPSANPDSMPITSITARGGAGTYRDPCPTTSGALVAVASTATTLDSNVGTATAPKSRFDFRLASLAVPGRGTLWTNEQFLTAGLTNVASYWVGSRRVTQTNRLWELQPVEVAVRRRPSLVRSTIDPLEANVFVEEGVDAAEFQAWLRTNALALVVSRNVTRRDRADREQPFNLRVAGTTIQALGTAGGKVYDLRYIQFLQADQLRGLTLGQGDPVPGRRVLAIPMHEPAAASFNVPSPQAPMGATRLADDGSQATLVPARRAMTHQLVDPSGNAIVRERYWLTYQPGEIRTCANCHGINTSDQTGQPRPANPPQALRDLLRYWKDQARYARILAAAPTNGSWRVQVSAAPVRTNVLEATSDFLAWQAIGTNLGTTNGVFYLDDPAWTNHPQRFYRTRGEGPR